MYEFNWEGKELAYKLAQTPSTRTLIPDKESSKNWDTTENLYIEGDNLEVLKLLQKSYFGKVKMIYIDPPYNTGNDFVYHDNFKDNIANYKEITNQSTKANSETNGRYHTDWLNMMYPRLKLARNLLREDGVIFISIDDNENSNLIRIGDEIFSENNRLAILIWKKKYTGGKGSSTFADYHEYILVYSKDKNSIGEISMARPEEEKEKFIYKDKYFNERGRYYTRPLKSNLDPRPTLVYPIELPDGSSVTTQWICAKDTYEKLKLEGRIEFKDSFTSEYPVYKKFYEFDSDGKVKIPSFIEISNNNEAKSELKNIFNIKQTRDLPFQTPKPTPLLKLFIDNFTEENDIIMDFFSGSASTAHAVFSSNIENNTNKRFLMVQLPEKLPEKDDIRGNEFLNICEIGKERIRRAGDKIVSENKDKEGIENLDIGFKVFKLSYDNSNNKGDDKMYNEKLIELSNKTNIMYKEHQVYELKDMYFYILNAYEEYIEWRYKNDVFWHIEHSEEFYNRLMNPMKIEILTNKKPKELKGKKKIATINKDADYKVQVFIDDDYNLYYQDNHAFASCESKIVDNKVETIWNSCKCWFKITGLYECRNNHMVDILRDLNSYSEYLYPKNNVADNVMLSRLYEQMVNVYLDYVND